MAALENFRRSELERHIEELIALLDLLDDDADLEDEGDLEPSLGWPEQFGLSALANVPEHDDREREDENNEDGGDAEPEETDQNGDEQDCCHSEDEFNPLQPDMRFDGAGVDMAEAMIEANPSAQKKARRYADAPPLPLVYDFRGT